MDTLKTPRRRRLVNLPSGPLVAAHCGGKWLNMRTEKLGRTSLFLVSHSYVPLRTIFQLHIRIAPAASPLRMLGSSTFLERTWNGYGIGVELASPSQDEQRRWSEFLSAVPALGTATATSCAQLRPIRQDAYSGLLSIGQALPARSIAALRGAGLDVECVDTAAEALERVQTGNIGTVVGSAKDGPGSDFSWCERLRALRPTARPVVLLEGRSDLAYDRALHAGAALVVGMPCSYKLLHTRLTDLHLREPSSDSSAELQPVPQQHRRSSGADSGARSLLATLSGWASEQVLAARQYLSRSA